jgi:cytochrome c
MRTSGFCSGIFFLLLISGMSGFQNADNTDKYRNGDISVRKTRSENHKPVVKIIEPIKNSVYHWNRQVPYTIDVSDSEDGDSKYQEISPNEVFIRLKFARDEMAAAAYLNQKKFRDTLSVNGMIYSNCFNCHAVKAKLAGPSFQEIINRYPLTNANLVRLVNHVKNGSAGIWGNEAMPRHPELTDSAITQMIKWIYAFSNDPGLNYFVGLKGNLTLDKPAKNLSGGIFIISAFYTDHGTVANPAGKITGADHLMIRVRQ